MTLRRIAGLFSGLLLLTAAGFPGTARAAGTAAGLRIESTASASYTESNAARSVSSNPVSILVDELLSVSVASLDGAPVRTTGATAALSFSVTNTGNGPEAFALQADAAPTGSDFAPIIRQIALDTNDNGVFDPGIDMPVARPAQTGLIAPDASVRVFVEVGLPPEAVDAAQAQVVLTARAATGSGPPGTSFAGQGERGSTAVVGATTASSAGQGAIIANLATIVLIKSATVADPFGGTQAVTGAQVTYSILAQVTGSGAVNDLVVTDPLPAGVTYQAASLRLDGQPLSDAADSDEGAFAAGTVSVRLGAASGGTSHTITFAVRIE